MVKRQTVWLSTMMVLSLMLIGYYTMNNDPNSGVKPSDVTAAVTPDTGSGSTDSSSSKPTSSNPAQTPTASSQNGSSTAGQSSTDWYVNSQTKQEQQLAQKMDMYEKVITNNNSTPDQLSQAEQQLNRLTSLQGGLDNAHDAIVAQGYKDCVVVPNSDYSKFTVYVKTDKLTADQAVGIMHIVSQQLNVSATAIAVSAKA